MEAKYHRESLLQDRKTLTEQLKALKQSVQGSLDETSDENKTKVRDFCKVILIQQQLFHSFKTVINPGHTNFHSNLSCNSDERFQMKISFSCFNHTM